MITSFEGSRVKPGAFTHSMKTHDSGIMLPYCLWAALIWIIIALAGIQARFYEAGTEPIIIPDTEKVYYIDPDVARVMSKGYLVIRP